MPDTTLLAIAEIDVPPYSARGLSQTLQPIGGAGQMRRTVNGTLVDISAPQFRKYRSSIACTDQQQPALDGVWPGRTLTVSCVSELSYKTGGAAQRTAVSGSSRTESGFTFYRPVLSMKVIDYRTDTDEWGAAVGWNLELEEVEPVSVFYFAWSGPTETTFSAGHQVEDEEVYSFELSHTEGELPELTIDIRNPSVGLLAPGRQRWAWLSYNNGVTVTPLFFGRIVGVPKQLTAEIVQLAFVARPLNYDAQKRAVAASLRVIPYYDPVWIADERRDDPDAVLEGYAALWHIDRVTHSVTHSSILNGEDGIVDFNSEFFYDSLSLDHDTLAARRIQVEAEISWDQTATGSVDLTQYLIDKFAAAGSGNGHIIRSLTGGGLMGDWPEEGQRIGGGWEVGTSSVMRTDGIATAPDFQQVVMTNGDGQFPVWSIRPSFWCNYDVSRTRIERVAFTLEADVQPLVTEPGDEEVILFSVASQDVAMPIDAGGAVPIGDVRARAYLPTARGRQSLEALITLARALLLKQARAVMVSFEVPFDAALGLSCRKNASVLDDRLPGGVAAGKVTGYTLRCNGDSGELAAGVTIGCSIGKGNTVSTVGGTPTYVATGYVDTGYQVYAGQTYMPVAGEVTYAEFGHIPPNDDSVDFFSMNAANNVVQMTVINGETEQRAALSGSGFADMKEAIDVVNAVYTEVDMDLRVLTGGPFETLYPITVSDMMVPRTINLEAT